MVTTSWIIIRSVVIVIGFILVYSLLQFFIGIHPPRYYDKHTPTDYDLEYENVSFATSDGITIKGWILESKNADRTIIVGHGYPFDKGNIFPVAKFLYPEYNLLFYDHRYFGESEGRITTVGIHEIKDVKAAVKFVQGKFGKEKPIALYGFSLSASAMLMAQPKVNAIIADSPYADLERMIIRTYFYFGPLKWPFVKTTSFLGKVFFKISPKDISPAKAIKKSTIPTLIIHGEKDSQILVENAHVLKESNPKIDLWIIEGADHGQAQALFTGEYEKRVKSFLQKHMKS
jgi:pimeloyl-ACP methyl ester carboxylesterase|tara:strand:- start:344 stop:1207 length:864 start_codon:yes stop_codon:yes gene_type:complete